SANLDRAIRKRVLGQDHRGPWVSLQHRDLAISGRELEDEFAVDQSMPDGPTEHRPIGKADRDDSRQGLLEQIAEIGGRQSASHRRVSVGVRGCHVGSMQAGRQPSRAAAPNER
ncbi:MAG TPA: hypothetical protein VFY18_00055, partial [Candidatus Limnocylindrales bacterium]|nr:hypothetical protein [Candidatus Limnocylindrales bacterium]